MDTTVTELLKGGGSWVCRPVAGRSLGGVNQIFTVRQYCVSQCYTVLVLVASSAGRSSRAVDSTRAGHGRQGRELHTAGHSSQSSVARLAARARQLCRDSARAGRGRLGCQLHTAGHPSQSSVARLAACARQLSDSGQHPGGSHPLTTSAALVGAVPFPNNSSRWSNRVGR